MAGEIIGRREELLALEAFLGAVPAGGQALLLEGDAGIGKSALWYEGLRLARERGFRVLTARAARSETQVAFATVGDLFAPVLEATLPRLVPVQRRALEIALLLRESDGRPPDARLLGLALLSVVRALAQDGPLLVALDDVQWIDASSAEVLRFVLWRLEGEPVGVLATVRERPVEAPLELDRAFAVVSAAHGRASQRRGDPSASLGSPRAQPCRDPLLLRVHEIAGGNPFFALELGRGLVDGTIRADGTDVALPESLVALVTERLRALPARVRETLVAVAALAAPSVVLLEALGPAVVDDIELAQKRGVLELDGDRIRFTHPLLAPACYTAMPLHRRRRLHRRLAELDVDPEERARHLALAASGPDEEIAAALETAAPRPRARGAAQAAAELAERAVALTPLGVHRHHEPAAHARGRALPSTRATSGRRSTCSSRPPTPPRRARCAPRYSAGSRDVSAVTEEVAVRQRLCTPVRSPSPTSMRASGWRSSASSRSIPPPEATLEAAPGTRRRDWRSRSSWATPMLLPTAGSPSRSRRFCAPACIRRDLLEPAIDIARRTGGGPARRRPALARSRFSSVEPIAATRHVACGES